MKKLLLVTAALVLLASSVVAQATATIDWKGVTWDITNATAAINGDGSLTLTSTAASSAGVALHANRLTPSFASIMDPWVQWSYSGHKADILIETETIPGPTVQAGTLWGIEFAVTRYTSGATRPEEYFFGQTATDPISHVLNIGKRLDGTVDAQFDSNPWASTTYLKTNVGSDWAFQDVYLRMRAAQIGDTVTFADFQYGSGHNAPPAVPEPMSIMLGLMGLGSVAGYRKLRK